MGENTKLVGEVDWLEQLQGDEGSVKSAITRLKQLEFAMREAEEAYKEAKQAFESYSRRELVDAFTRAGLTSVTMDDGRTAEVKTTVRASVVKSKAENVARWLEQNGCGDIVTRNCAVPSTYRDTLISNNVAFEDVLDFNTNTIKRVVRDMMEQGVVAQSDLPDGLAWFQYDEVVVK